MALNCVVTESARSWICEVLEIYLMQQA